MKIMKVGGPLAGAMSDRPKTEKLVIRIPRAVTWPDGKEYDFRTYTYSLRRVRDYAGSLVEILAPHGEPIDPEYLAANNLTAEN